MRSIMISTSASAVGGDIDRFAKLAISNRPSPEAETRQAKWEPLIADEARIVIRELEECRRATWGAYGPMGASAG